MKDAKRQKIALLEKSGLSREQFINILTAAGYDVTPFVSFSELPRNSFGWSEFDAVIIDPDAGDDTAADRVNSLVPSKEFPPELRLIVYTFNEGLTRSITEESGFVNCVFLSKSNYPGKLIPLLATPVEETDPESESAAVPA